MGNRATATVAVAASFDDTVVAAHRALLRIGATITRSDRRLGVFAGTIRADDDGGGENLSVIVGRVDEHHCTVSIESASRRVTIVDDQGTNARHIARYRQVLLVDELDPAPASDTVAPRAQERPLRTPASLNPTR